MSKNKRLGSVPRGLEWIDEGTIALQDTLPIEALTPQEIPAQSQCKPLAQPQELEDERESLLDVRSAERGLPKGWTRATLIVRQEHLKKLKALAYWDRVTIKHLLDKALSALLDGKRVRSTNVKKV